MGKEPTCNAGDLGSITGLGKSPGGGHGNPLQYSGLDNSMGCIVYEASKNQTWLSELPSLTLTAARSRIFLLGTLWTQKFTFRDPKLLGYYIHLCWYGWKYSISHTHICTYVYIHIHIYMYVCILFQILFPSRLPQDIGYSSLCYTVGPCCSSILYIVHLH